MKNYLKSFTQKLITKASDHRNIVIAGIILLVVIFIIRFISQALYKIPSAPVENPENFLHLVSTEPNPPVFKSVWSVEPVIFTFDDYLDADTIRYSVYPSTTTRYESHYNPSKLIKIIPLDGWQEGVSYRITISKELTSLSGKKLIDNVQLIIKREIPESGDPNYPQFPPQENVEYP
jgi:hypothetical protein